MVTSSDGFEQVYMMNNNNNGAWVDPDNVEAPNITLGISQILIQAIRDQEHYTEFFFVSEKKL